LALTYSDGCFEKDRYEQELSILRKQESGIHKQLGNLNPELRMKAQNLQRLIKESQRLLNKGTFLVNGERYVKMYNKVTAFFIYAYIRKYKHPS
jgi:hypothetical protein